MDTRLDDVQLEARDDALRDIPTLLDWRRRVAALYHDVRSEPDPQRAWEHWREARDRLIGSHPQSPLAADRRGGFTGVPYFDYDPRFRVTAVLVASDAEERDIGTSRWSSYRFTRFAGAEFELLGRPLRLDCFWLEGYAGGLFLPFGDATNGATTYGAGRYLLDTVKGTDLGSGEGTLVLDFNFAYNPSCAYNERWVCPLAPMENRLPVAVQAGGAGVNGGFDFEQAVRDAIDALPEDLRSAMSNVAIVVDEDSPPDSPILGLYQGIPLTRRGAFYAAAPPDKITIYRRPIERVAGTDPERLRHQVQHVVIHEIAHHFGISDERLVELGKY